MKSLDEKPLFNVMLRYPEILLPLCNRVCVGCVWAVCATRCVALSQPIGSRQALAVCCQTNLSQRGINFLVDFTALTVALRGPD